MDRTEKVELTVLCLLRDGDRILLQNRVKEDWQGYTLPGGHVEPGETAQEAAVRETCEELLVKPEQVEVLAPMHRMADRGKLVIDSFLGLVHDYRGSFLSEEVARVFTVPLNWLLEYEPEVYTAEMEVRLGDEFPYELSPSVETINIRYIVPKYFDPDGPNYRSRWTYIGLIRAALSKVFPQYDKILSIDCDTIVAQNVSDLWDIDLGGYYFAAVKEPVLSSTTHGLYTNVGVMMMNLKKLRDGKDTEMIKALNTRAYYFVSQDVLNGLCRGSIRELPGEYNVCDYTIPSTSVKIIHYAGKNNWRNNDIVVKYREMEWPR